MKDTTPVDLSRFPVHINRNSRIMVLGSCFATNMGERLASDGYDVCINPFGNIFNPWSVADSVERLEECREFTQQECIPMGAGAGKICSFSHHTSFARGTNEEFLENANRKLKEASRLWRECDTVIITYGTAQVWRHNGKVVSNCLKRPNYEFTHEMLSPEEVELCIKRTVKPGKTYIFTVSPIRHLGEGAHTNTISKSTLQLAIHSCGCNYFPSYEIMLDELRDYSWYAEDLVHPNQEAIDYICGKFEKAAISPREI